MTTGSRAWLPERFQAFVGDEFNVDQVTLTERNSSMRLTPAALRSLYTHPRPQDDDAATICLSIVTARAAVTARFICSMSEWTERRLRPLCASISAVVVGFAKSLTEKELSEISQL
jgi:hypothetical protein